MKDAPYQYAACKVERIVDGDTVDLAINLGFSIFTKKRIRLYGIDAPETRTRNLKEKARGEHATARLIELLQEGVCDLESHELDKFGRVLGTLWVGDVNVNRQLVVEGFAVEYHGGKR